jgi:tartrate dehydrogenase/decarboxylase/D-malate dehydrogenase
MQTWKIAVIPGDGIGKEVIAAAVDVLKACAERDGGFLLSFTKFDWGSERYKDTGLLMPDDGVETLKRFDAILFGAVGTPDLPDHVTLWGLRLAICQALQQYANVRPVRLLSAAGCRPARHRLGHRSGELRRRIFGAGRSVASRI